MFQLCAPPSSRLGLRPTTATQCQTTKTPVPRENSVAASWSEAICGTPVIVYTRRGQESTRDPGPEDRQQRATGDQAVPSLRRPDGVLQMQRDLHPLWRHRPELFRRLT